MPYPFNLPKANQITKCLDIKVAIVISNGWVLRNLLETGVLQQSGLFAKTTFIIDARIADNGVKILNKYKANYQIVKFEYSYLSFWLKTLLLYIQVYRYAPKYSINKFRGVGRKIMGLFFTTLNMVGLLAYFHEKTIFLFRRQLKRESVNFDLNNFDVFLSASPNAIQDNHVSVHARRINCPTINLILSWDNIFAKGYMAPSDLYVVWGEIMERQLKVFFDIPQDKIFILGAPHIGGVKPTFENDYERDTLLYSTAAAVHFPDEKDLVKKLSKDYLAGAFPNFKRFVIRTHPAGPNDIYDDLALPEAGIFVQHPSSLGDREISKWMPEVNELTKLGEQLSRVAVAINLASTMSLDCLAHGVSVINITAAINGRDLSRHYRSEHYAALIDLNLVILAGSYGDLVKSINEAPLKADANIVKRIETFIYPTNLETLENFHDRVVQIAAR